MTDVKVGQKRAQEQAESARGKVAPESVRVLEEGCGRLEGKFKVQYDTRRTSWLLRTTIQSRWPVVVTEAPDADGTPLTPAEASAIQDVAEVERLRREVEEWKAKAAAARNAAIDEAADRINAVWWQCTNIAEDVRALKSAPAEPVFTAAQVREAVEGVASEGSGGGQYPLMQSTAREILKRLGITR